MRSMLPHVALSALLMTGCADGKQPGGTCDGQAGGDHDGARADSGVCGPGINSCAGKCVQLQTDEDNCGGCGKKCAAGQLCSAGKCTSFCPAGLTACSGACLNMLSDHQNCGV